MLDYQHSFNNPVDYQHSLNRKPTRLFKQEKVTKNYFKLQPNPTDGKATVWSLQKSLSFRIEIKKKKIKRINTLKIENEWMWEFISTEHKSFSSVNQQERT